MPSYEYRCSSCSEFEVFFPMGQASASMSCPRCGQPSPRRLSVPRLGFGSSAARRLIESTSRSADQPDVVQTIPRAAPRPTPSSTTHPLHRKLPRP